jgi:hypothetical protein
MKKKKIEEKIDKDHCPVCRKLLPEDGICRKCLENPSTLNSLPYNAWRTGQHRFTYRGIYLFQPAFVSLNTALILLFGGIVAIMIFFLWLIAH